MDANLGAQVRIRQMQFRRQSQMMRHPPRTKARIYKVYKSPCWQTERYDMIVDEANDDEGPCFDLKSNRPWNEHWRHYWTGKRRANHRT